MRTNNEEGFVVSPMPTGSGAIIVHRQLEMLLPNYHVVPYSRMRELLPPLVGFQRLGRAVAVHTAPDHAMFLARRGRPLVITFHNLVVDAFMRPYSTPLQRLHYATDLRWFIRRALRRADAVTAVSQFIADLVRSEFDFVGDIAVISNGVDVVRFSPGERKREGNQVNILFAGNLTLRKGAHWLAEIADRLPAGVDLACASGLRGGDTASLAKRKNVRILGKISYNDMPEIYCSADIFLFPTVREGMSLALLEAMACGLPVVATDCSSNPELVHPGRGGYLCPLGDVDAFVSALRDLIESPERRQRMGAYNRFLVESQYPLDRMALSYAAIFNRVALPYSRS